jgi:ubiquinone/menaquinone biosynthesis C-methylase UbiE
MDETGSGPDVDLNQLREAIRCEYREVARSPQKGFHFHTGRRLAEIVEYRDEWLEGIPDRVIECFAGTGNPFSIAPLRPGERVVDLGCGAGIDMTPEMLSRARGAGEEAGLAQVEFRQGYLEQLPVDDAWADVVISNGVVNLCPDKMRAYGEIHRVLKPGGRMQIADIMVHKQVSDEAKRRIDLWTG